MQRVPLCPHCSKPLVDAGDVPDSDLTEMGTNWGTTLVLWCNRCGKVISAFPYKKSLRQRLNLQSVRRD
jgi:RNase P subunit RPR2